MSLSNSSYEDNEYLLFFRKLYQHFLHYINREIDEVYHYTSIDTMNLILTNSTMRFSNINYLNDECEFTYFYLILADLLPQYRIKYSQYFCDELNDICSEYCNDNYYYVGDDIKKDLDRQYYIASFSLTDDNLALWTLYTKDKNFIGCNFGINPNKICLYNDDEILFKGAVIYDREEQENILNEVIACLSFKYENSSDKKCFRNCLKKVLSQYALFFKHHAFKQENEYRFIYYPSNEFDVQNIDTKPFIDISFNTEIDIQNVRLSPTLRENCHIKYIKEMFKKHNANTENFTFSDIPFCL